MRRRFTEAAAAELDASVDYLVQHAPHVAARFADSIDAAIDEVLEYPYSAQETERAGAFRKYVRAFRYAVFYAVDAAADEIVILSIRRAARRWPWQE
jgi:plasmid stabilization system protein ParE